MENFSTIAEVSVTLAGFSGLFFAFRQRTSQPASPEERRGLAYLLLTSLSAAVLSLLPLSLGSLASQPATWVVLPALSGLVLLYLEIRLMRQIGFGRGSRFPRTRAAFVPFNWLMVLLQFAGAASLLPPPLCFGLGLWWLVLHASIQFLMQALWEVSAG